MTLLPWMFRTCSLQEVKPAALSVWYEPILRPKLSDLLSERHHPIIYICCSTLLQGYFTYWTCELNMFFTIWRKCTSLSLQTFDCYAVILTANRFLMESVNCHSQNPWDEEEKGIWGERMWGTCVQLRFSLTVVGLPAVSVLLIQRRHHLEKHANYSSYPNAWPSLFRTVDLNMLLEPILHTSVLRRCRGLNYTGGAVLVFQLWFLYLLCLTHLLLKPLWFNPLHSIHFSSSFISEWMIDMSTRRPCHLLTWIEKSFMGNTTTGGCRPVSVWASRWPSSPNIDKEVLLKATMGLV